MNMGYKKKITLPNGERDAPGTASLLPSLFAHSSPPPLRTINAPL